MDTVSETSVSFLLNNAQCFDEGNSRPIAADYFIPTLQKNEVVDESQPSCSGLHLKPTSKSRSKDQEAYKPSFPWKSILPKRGVSKLIFQVVASIEKRTGISLQALKKSVAATGYDLEKRKSYFKRVLKALVRKGVLRKLTGRGLTGSYAISKMMLDVLRRRRRRKAISAMSALKKNMSSKRSRKKKTKPRKSDPSDLCSPMSMTGNIHS
ncbi:histone H1B-like [Elgaria multicarinata webbii]|uniref:histone H1B-like n=1 Tax=Elgaria multicarinata webbii TaxID=159646 RepID=UPI002FCCBCFB